MAQNTYQEEALPTGEIICDDVHASIANNIFRRWWKRCPKKSTTPTSSLRTSCAVYQDCVCTHISPAGSRVNTAAQNSNSSIAKVLPHRALVTPLPICLGCLFSPARPLPEAKAPPPNLRTAPDSASPRSPTSPASPQSPPERPSSSSRFNAFSQHPRGPRFISKEEAHPDASPGGAAGADSQN